MKKYIKCPAWKLNCACSKDEIRTFSIFFFRKEMKRLNDGMLAIVDSAERNGDYS